jgi:hypothetical protein
MHRREIRITAVAASLGTGPVMLFGVRAAFALALVACSASDDLPPPQISAVAPTHAPPSTTVTIIGDYFCHQLPNDDPLACANVGAVEFGADVATAGLYTDTSIMAEVPAGIGTVRLVVTVAGRVSNGVDFTFD